MKMDWKTSLGTVVLYSLGGAAAGYYAVGAEHSDSPAVERTFVTPASRATGAQRGAMAGGLFSVGLIGLFGTLSHKGATRWANAGVAVLGFGGLLWSLNKFRTERTAEAPRGTSAAIPAASPAVATTTMANEASTPPAQLQADIAQTIDQEFDPSQEVTNADLLNAGTTSGLGRLAALRRRGAEHFRPHSWR